MTASEHLRRQSVCLMGDMRNWILVCFHKFYIDKITASEYGFIVSWLKPPLRVRFHRFYIDEFTLQSTPAKRYPDLTLGTPQMYDKSNEQGEFLLLIFFHKNFLENSKIIYIKGWVHFWEIQFQSYITLYQHPWQQNQMHSQKDFFFLFII